LRGRELPEARESTNTAPRSDARRGVGFGPTAPDPDMTPSYQKGHARKVLRIDMVLPRTTSSAFVPAGALSGSPFPDGTTRHCVTC
jgi:hypothetical protein